MANKKTKNNNPSKSTRILRVMLIVFSILLILSMVLSLLVNT
ncbi:MAG TPA: hypothetical protein VJ022_07030 [Anaerolineales bacterium]|nr:hypothetical protein [Anaerolineales bacterium]